MKLLIADDHTLFRDALVQYIERASPGSFVALAKDFAEVRETLSRRSDFDLIILDLRMPGMNGFEGLKYIRDTFPQKPVAIMSGVAEEEDVRTALGMGARGYFPKTMSGKTLVVAIQEVLSGAVFVPYDDNNKAAYMPAYYNDPPAAPRPKPHAAHDSGNGTVLDSGKAQEVLIHLGLTPRERQIVGFLTAGATNKDIGLALDLQVVTVKLHVRSICRKLEASNRTQAALKLRDYGLTPENTAVGTMR